MHTRKIFLTIFAFCLFTSTAQASSKQSLFSIYNIETPFVINQPIIAANLIDNTSDELLAFGNDEQKQTWLAIYVLDKQTKSYQLYKKQVIPKKYFAYDLSDFISDDKSKLRTLYFLAKDEVVHFQISPVINNNESKPFISKQKVSSMYLVNSEEFISRKNFIQDVNQDGKDDIYLPHFEQINLWLSQCCGQLHYQPLPLASFIEHDSSKVTFNQRQLFFADFNFDKKQDLAWIKQGRIEYFAQTTNGQFSSTPQEIIINNSIYGLNWWHIKEADGDNLDQSKLAHRMVEQLKDVNGDGLIDLVVRFTQSSGVLDRTNEYEFYFGQQAKDNLSQIVFAQLPDTVIKAEGTLVGLKIIDINDDDKFEVMLSSFELSLTNIIGALISGGIDQNVLLFSLNNQDNFEDKAIASKDVELSFSLSNGRSGQPIVQLADINGDELQDLILSDDEDTLKVYLGKSGKRKFAKKPLKQDMLLAKDGQFVKSHDVNQDGKQDFIMSYTRLDEGNMLNTFTILIAN